MRLNFKIECKGTAFSRFVQINREKSFGFVDFATRIACFDGNLAVVEKNLINEMPYATVAFFCNCQEK